MVRLRARLYQVALVRWADVPKAAVAALDLPPADIKGAIKGAQRADIFFGTGDAAGNAAGTVKDGGRMIVLLPIDRAYAMLPEG